MKLVVIGASGGCADLIDVARDINDAGGDIDVLGCLDDRADLEGRTVFGARVLGPTRLAREMGKDVFFATAVGNHRTFRERAGLIASLGVPEDRWATLIHPTAVVSRFSTVGPGSAILPNSTISGNVTIGTHVQILPNCVISHDARVGDYTLVNGSCLLAGTVHLGQSCYVGARTCIRQGVRVGDRALIGMGSVVLNDLPAESLAYGVPARVRHPAGE